ncbi:hypothetical protein EV363DRAFT_1431409 [Boletus edulis]|nr:hypothetical protein EV363DRAFT_1431409 [Boletus edulis]
MTHFSTGNGTIWCDRSIAVILPVDVEDLAPMGTNSIYVYVSVQSFGVHVNHVLSFGLVSHPATSSMHLPGDVTTVSTVYGAILLGTCFGCGLTGIVFVQCILYYKLYPNDFAWTKALVFAVWTFDMMHTICIICATWESVIANFNQPEKMDEIPPALGLSVAVTAAVTFMVHCFFANRIRLLTKKWYIAVPVVFLAFLRLFAACVSTGEIIHLKRYSLFIKPYPSWVFTLGVTLSASVEVIITTIMVIFLGSRRTGFANMDHIINSLILYTLETGGFTCLVTIASLLCWLLMRHNLIFLGMHFTIAKLYANSLLATLNMRQRFRAERTTLGEQDHIHQLSPMHNTFNKSQLSNRVLTPNWTQEGVPLNVNVETIIVSQADEHNHHCDIVETPRDRHFNGMGRGSGDNEDQKYPFLI